MSLLYLRLLLYTATLPEYEVSYYWKASIIPHMICFYFMYAISLIDASNLRGKKAIKRHESNTFQN